MATTQIAAAAEASALTVRESLLRRVFSFPAFMAGLLVAGIFVAARNNLLDPDTWWHLKVGRTILATGTWPTTDPYSFTASGHGWMAYEWLGEVVMALSARAGTLRTPTVLLVSLSSLLFLLLFYYATLRSGNSKAAFAACVAALPPLAAFFTLRPQLFGYVFLLVLLILLEHARRGREWVVWLLPPMFLLWVNTHGTFVFGFLVVGAVWLSGLFEFRCGGLWSERWAPRQRIRLLLATLGSVLVLPLTPYGARLAAYPLQMALLQPVNVANIQEWQPLGMDHFMGRYVLALLLLYALAQVALRISHRLSDLALVLFAVFAAAVHTRFLLLLLVVFTPVLAELLARWAPAYNAAKDRPLLNLALLALITAGLIYLFPTTKDLDDLAGRRYPRDAVEYLRSHPTPARMLNEYGWGGYLIWAASPGRQVFIDGRADLYEYSGVFSDYLHIVRLDKDALLLLRKYNIDACLISRDSPLSTVLAALPDWRRVYADKVSALYERVPQARLSEAHPVAETDPEGRVGILSRPDAGAASVR